MQVEQNVDAVVAAVGHDAGERVEEGGGPDAGLRLEGAPRQRQAQEVEPEGRHACNVVVGQVGDGFEWSATVVEGDVEQARDAGVDAAQDDGAAVSRAELAMVDVERRVVRLRRRAADERCEEQQQRELHAAEDRPNEQTARIPRAGDGAEESARPR